jgi:hypothetical protein
MFVDSFFVHGGKWEENENWLRWLKAMRADPDLRKPYIDYLESRKKESLRTIAWMDEAIRNVESTDQKV